MESLGTDTLLCVYSYLDLKSVCRFLQTTKSLAVMLTDDLVWKILLTRETRPSLSLSIDPGFSVKKCAPYTGLLWTNLPVQSSVSFLRRTLESFKRVQTLPMRGVAESSHDFDQDIRRTVSARPDLFWSSIGAATRDSNDFLRYELDFPALVFWVGIRLFRAGFQGGVLYPPQRFQLKIGRNDTTWDFVSEPIQAMVSESVQHLIVLPALILGKFVEVELIGKQQTQETDDLYYVAIEQVTCVGLPVGIFGEESGLENGCPRPVGQMELEITAENYQDWVDRFKENPDSVQWEYLEAFQELGKVGEYFETVMKHRQLNKKESYFYFESSQSNEEVKPKVFRMYTLSEDLGDLMYSKGHTLSALRVYSHMQISRKIVKCLLKLGQYKQCLIFVNRYRGFDQPTIEEAKAMAKNLGENISAEFEAVIRELTQQAEVEAEASSGSEGD